MRQGVGTAGTSFRKEAASSASCSARQQQMHDAGDAQLQEALRASRREQQQVPYAGAVVVHRGANASRETLV